MGIQSGCTSCDNGQGCGAGLFARLLKRKPVIIELARQGLNAEPGQMVTLALPEVVYLKLVFVFYGWPLLAALLGASAGYGLGVWQRFPPVTIDMLTLACGLLTGIFVLRTLRKRYTPGMTLKSLDMTVCNLSATPNICSRN